MELHFDGTPQHVNLPQRAHEPARVFIAGGLQSDAAAVVRLCPSALGTVTADFQPADDNVEAAITLNLTLQPVE
jgi:hypothetical protein